MGQPDGLVAGLAAVAQGSWHGGGGVERVAAALERRHRQGRGQPAAVIELAEQDDRLGVMLRREGDIAEDVALGAQQIVGLGLAGAVTGGAVERKGLEVVVAAALGLLGVGLPVAEAVQALGQDARVVQAAGHIERTLEMLARATVVAPGPEEAELDQALPLGASVAEGAGRPQGLLVALARGVPRAQGLVHLRCGAQQLNRGWPLKLPHGVERQAVVVERLARRVEDAGLVASGHAVGQRPLPEAGGGAVPGQLARPLAWRRAIQLFERLRNPPVQGLALVGGQCAVDRLAGEGVAKGEQVAALPRQQLGLYQLRDEGLEHGLVQPRQGLEQGGGEAPANRRGEVEHPPRRGVEPGHAPLDRVLHATRRLELGEALAVPAAVDLEDIAGVDERLEHLLDEEGVALSQLGHCRHELAAHRGGLVKDRADHLRDGVGGQRLEHKLVGQALAVELREQPAERRGSLVAAVAQQQGQGPLGRGPRQAQQQLERELVAPVEIFNNDERRARAGGAGRGQPGRPGAHELALLLLGLRDRRQGHRGERRHQVGCELEQLGGRGGKALLQLARRGSGEQIDEGREGGGAILREAVALEHGPAARGGDGPGLAQQP